MWISVLILYANHIVAGRVRHLHEERMYNYIPARRPVDSNYKDAHWLANY